MDFEELGYTDFITMHARERSPTREMPHIPDFHAIADAERADAEVFRLV